MLKHKIYSQKGKEIRKGLSTMRTVFAKQIHKAVLGSDTSKLS